MFLDILSWGTPLGHLSLFLHVEPFMSGVPHQGDAKGWQVG